MEDKLQEALDENEGIHDLYTDQIKDLKHKVEFAMN
jgi:hypothetical protein